MQQDREGFFPPIFLPEKRYVHFINKHLTQAISLKTVSDQLQILS